MNTRRMSMSVYVRVSVNIFTSKLISSVSFLPIYAKSAYVLTAFYLLLTLPYISFGGKSIC